MLGLDVVGSTTWDFTQGWVHGHLLGLEEVGGRVCGGTGKGVGEEEGMEGEWERGGSGNWD